MTCLEALMQFEDPHNQVEIATPVRRAMERHELKFAAWAGPRFHCGGGLVVARLVTETPGLSFYLVSTDNGLRVVIPA